MLFSRLVFFLILSFSLHGAELNVVEKKITVNGKESTVFAIEGDLHLEKGQPFDVELKNNLKVPTSVHWHGLILPNSQDGVAFITQYPLYPGESYHYQFPLVQSGTFWMHSHYGLQEQRLLSAPLIISEGQEKEAIIFLTDFSFTSPSEIYQKLRSGKMMKMGRGPDLSDVDYDAYLANNRTLQNPEVIDVNSGERIRLRIINGASATNFFIDLQGLEGEAIAVDGNRIHPMTGSIFELADAQRIDLLVNIPDSGGVFPILAQAEGTDKQTGLILATQGTPIPKLSERASKTAGALTNAHERQLRALSPLAPKKVDHQLFVELGGNMETYVWTINGQAWPESTPLIVKKGERVEMVFKNTTTMSHPMHFHGHVFQVKAIDGQEFDGAMRDTVLVTPESTVKVQFDADNPGVWPLHCHLLYHMEAGMFTVVKYKDFQQPL